MQLENTNHEVNETGEEKQNVLVIEELFLPGMFVCVRACVEIKIKV